MNLVMLQKCYFTNNINVNINIIKITIDDIRLEWWSLYENSSIDVTFTIVLGFENSKSTVFDWSTNVKFAIINI